MSKQGYCGQGIQKMVPGSLSNSNALLVYSDDHVIRTFVETPNQIKVNSEIKKHEGKCAGLDWSRVDERYFLSADVDRNIFLWDMNYNLSTPVIHGTSVEAVSDLQFVPYNGSMIFGVDHNGGFTLWDIRNDNSNFYSYFYIYSYYKGKCQGSNFKIKITP
jgi:WD40 repeat protein